MKTKIHFIYILLFVLAVNGYSQKEKYNTLIMGVPQYLIINGIRIDVDRNLNEGNRWLVFSPQFYMANEQSVSGFGYRTYPVTDLLGFGMGMQYKYVFSKKGHAEGLYLAAGASYNYFDITSKGVAWVPESEDSKILIREERDLKTKINKMGVQSTIGIQGRISEDFFIDMFLGFGLRLSIDETESGGITDLSTFAGDYAYSGTNLVAGIRLGIGY